MFKNITRWIDNALYDWNTWLLDRIDALIVFTDSYGNIVGKVSLCIYMTLPLVVTLFTPEMKVNFKIFSRLNIATFGEDLALIAVIFMTVIFLSKVPVLNWSIGKLFNKNSKGGNINLIPAQIKYFGPMFVLLLMANMPRLAMLEENIFRQGTTNWTNAILRSLIFGFAHCLVGVPLSCGFAISIAGLWFSRAYFIGGTQLSTDYHTAYNLILLLLLLVLLVIDHINVLRKKSK